MKRYYLVLAFVLVFLIPNLLFSLCEKEPDARIDAETEPSASTEECGRILVKSADGHGDGIASDGGRNRPANGAGRISDGSDSCGDACGF